MLRPLLASALCVFAGCLASAEFNKVPEKSVGSPTSSTSTAADGGSNVGGSNTGGNNTGGMAGFGGEPAAGGSGGLGSGGQGGATTCPPWQGQAGMDCQPALLADPQNCCFPGRDCGGGACVDGSCQAVMLSGIAGQGEIVGIVTLEDRVLWANGMTMHIRSASKMPGSSTKLVDSGQWTTMMTANKTHAFWSQWNDGEVWRANINGQTLKIADVGVDAMAGFGNLAVHGDNLLFAMSISGGIWLTKTDGSTPMPQLVANANDPAGVAIDQTYAYWSEGFVDGTIKRLALSEAGSGMPEVIAGAQAAPGALTLDETHLYWINANGNINQWPLSGGAASTLTLASGNPMGVVIDDEYVYWTEKDPANAVTGGALRRTIKGGDGAIETMTAGHPAQTRHLLAQDCTTIYFDHGDATVWKITK